MLESLNLGLKFFLVELQLSNLSLQLLKCSRVASRYLLAAFMVALLLIEVLDAIERRELNSPQVSLPAVFEWLQLNDGFRLCPL